MGWFDRTPAPPPAAPQVAKYTLEEAGKLLDDFGLKRVAVHDTNLKVVMSKIVWEAIPSLSKTAGDTPNSGDIAYLLGNLRMLIRTIDDYLVIQNNPNPDAYNADGGAAFLLQQGFSSVKLYYIEMSKAGPNSGDLSSYIASTYYLAGFIPPVA